jgi:hypothetical protein
LGKMRECSASVITMLATASYYSTGLFFLARLAQNDGRQI